jgi:hypothetical protein
MEIKINISELKQEGSEVVEELAGFLKEKTNAEIETATQVITVKSEGRKASKKYVRVVLKKFLHKTDLKDYFRVISDKEGVFVLKGKKAAEEE